MIKKENHAKIIFHIDMNAFFCSVACILNPSLRGKAFAVGRENTYKGVISTASYEARALGIHSAMPLSEAYKIKPDLIVVNNDYKIYSYYHKKFVDLIKEYTDIIEVASIDEVYADMTLKSLSMHPIVIAKEIQARLLKEYDLSASIGIAPTLFLAKMASDLKKPLGLVVLRKRDIKDILYPLSVKEIFGIGKKTYPILIDNGIKTIADFMDLNNKEKILNLIGDKTYDYAYNALSGNSSNLVMPNRYEKSESISTSQTYDIPLNDIEEALYELRSMLRSIFSRMNNDNYYTKCVNIQLRDTSFKTITRQYSLDEYTNDYQIIYNAMITLLEDNFNDNLSYRLIGVGLSNLVKKEDLKEEYNIFTVSTKEEKELAFNKLKKSLEEKYGNKVIKKG